MIHHIKIIEKFCKQCGICSSLCPHKVLEQTLGQPSQVINEQACSGCKLCTMCCPDFAIEVEVKS